MIVKHSRTHTRTDARYRRPNIPKMKRHFRAKTNETDNDKRQTFRRRRGGKKSRSPRRGQRAVRSNANFEFVMIIVVRTTSKRPGPSEIQ